MPATVDNLQNAKVEGVRSCNITMAKKKGTDLFFRKQYKQELPAPTDNMAEKI